MTSTDNRIDELISRLKAAEGMDNFTFVPAFPPDKTPNPVKKYTVAAETCGIENDAEFIGGSIGAGERGRLVKATLRLRVYAPQGSSGASLLRASSLAVSALERADRDRLITAVSLSGIGYETAAHSEYRDINVQLRLFVREEALHE